MEKMGAESKLIERSLTRKGIKNARKLGLPLGCGASIALCVSLIEMARMMNFTSLQVYINAFIKILGK